MYDGACSVVSPSVSVSIVLYKTPVRQIKLCLRSLKKVSPPPKLYMVDNSPDDSLRHVSQCYPEAEYIHLPNNPGFGSGHNQGIREAQQHGYEYHLVLNADVCFNDDVISPMIEYMDAHRNVAHMMPKILNPDESIQRLCKLVPAPSDLIMRRFLPGMIRKKSDALFEMHWSGYDKIMFVPYLSGCFMLLRHSALKEVGLFDERFFMYPEDIDLTRRMAEHYETLFFPHVSVVHEHAAASYKSWRMMFVHIYNIILYFGKWGWFFDAHRKSLNKKAVCQFEK